MSLVSSVVFSDAVPSIPFSAVSIYFLSAGR